MKYLRWFGRALRPHWMSVLCMMMCHVLLATCSVAFVYVSKKLVDVAVAILDCRMESDALTGWAVAMVVVIVTRVLLNASKSYLQTKTDIALKNRLRYNLFNVLLRVRNEGGARHHSGDVLNRMQEDVRQVSSVLAVSIPDLFGTLLQSRLVERGKGDLRRGEERGAGDQKYDQQIGNICRHARSPPSLAMGAST